MIIDDVSWCSRRCWGAANNWGLDLDNPVEFHEAGRSAYVWDELNLRDGPPGFTESNGGMLRRIVWRDDSGVARGLVIEIKETGEMNVIRDPAWKGHGIGRRLMHQAISRWGIDFSVQRYTAEGWAMTKAALPKETT